MLAVGHPATFRRTLEQNEKSWYMLLFQFAGIAEQWLSDNNWANFRTWARHPDSDAVIKVLRDDDVPADVAVFTGIHIHGPRGADYVDLGRCFFDRDGEIIGLSL